MAGKIQDIKEIRTFLRDNENHGGNPSGLAVSKRIADFYGDMYGVYEDGFKNGHQQQNERDLAALREKLTSDPTVEPLADWERELLNAGKQRVAMYAVQATLVFREETDHGIVSWQRQIPTFYLNGAVEGIRDYLHAERIATALLQSTQSDYDSSALEYISVSTSVSYWEEV